MPISVKRNFDGVDFYTRFDGRITVEEVADYFLEITSESDSFANKCALLEFGDVTFRGVRFDTVMQLARLTKQHQDLLEGSRTAVVASGPLAYGIVRMYIGIRDPSYDFEVFRTRDEAMDWLSQKAD